MTDTLCRWAALLTAVMIGVALPAFAQETKPGSPSSSMTGPPAPAASGLTDTLLAPGNGGIAGTGLGKEPSQPTSGPGTGMSVAGPPGMGVDPSAPKQAP